LTVIVLTGIPGVGSSTVAREALKMMGDDASRFKIVNYGDVMFEVAQEKGLVRSRDEIRKLESFIQRAIQQTAAKRIASMEGEVILDTHITIKTPHGYLPGLPRWVLDGLDPDEIILVEADPDEIHQRRSRDKSRSRDLDSVELIDEHQKVNRATGMAYAALSGATVKIIANHDNGLKETAGELLEVISG